MTTELGDKNIVLIGMPGCGKTTVARALGALTGRAVADADEEAEAWAGMPVPAFFAREGENAFRDLETRILARLGERSGIVLATGGGCVLRPENYPLLHRRGVIVWLQRDTALLSIEGRPLSQRTDLAAMYRRRAPLYRAFADHIVDNNRTVAQAAEDVLALFPTLERDL